MAYELYLVAPEGADGTPPSQIIAALGAAGLSATEQADASGHWLMLLDIGWC
jgi:hypothetical protein